MFVGNGSTLTIRSTTATTIDDTNSAVGGTGGAGTTAGGTNGNGNGGGLYVGIGGNAIFNTDNADIDIAGDIFSNGHITISGAGVGVVNFIGGTATHSTAFSTGTTINVGNTLNGTTDSLTGPIVNNGTLRFTQTTTGTFVGTVTGTGTVELAGTGRIILANAYSGNAVVNNGTLQGTTATLLGATTNNSNVDIQQNTDGTFTGTITGAGTVTKSGTGVVTMGTQTYTGATNVTQGRLFINGNSATSNVSVASGATFGINGTLAGSLVNAATLAPGNNAIGTTSVGTNFTNNNGTVQIQVAPTTTPVAGVTNDYIDVTNLAVVNGGTVNLVSGGATGYTSGTSYTFLDSAALTVNTPFTFVDDFAFFNATPFFNATSYGFTLFRDTSGFADAAQTPNQQAVANYLNATSGGAAGDYNTVLDQIASQPSTALPGIFDQLAGSVFVTNAAMGVQNATSVMLRLSDLSGSDTLGQPDVGGTSPLVYNDDDETSMSVVNLRSDDGTTVTPVLRFEGRRRRPWNGFSVGYGTWNNGLGASGNFGAGGTLTSIFRDLYTGIRVGVFGGYNYTRLNLEMPGQLVSNDNFTTGSYSRLENDDVYFLYANSFGYDSYSGRRRIAFGTIDRVASSEFGGWQTTQYLELGAKEVGWPLDFEPFLGLQYVYLKQDGFTETGADSLNISTNGVNFDSLRGLMGTRAAWGLGSFRPEMRAILLYDFMGSTPVMTSTFTGAGGAGFQTTGLDLGRAWGILGAGCTWACTDRLSFTANYDATLTRDSAFHMGSGSVQIYW
ncbi:MAG: autotransporter domain-containing protein [Planctomycetales bacterium]|nr:autotransporter domain-containing protein [Planctomycetales bacterium]MBN8627200.1 autotransporter domain-containing protein [Planctomycetota bacterium]